MYSISTSGVQQFFSWHLHHDMHSLAWYNVTLLLPPSYVKGIKMLHGNIFIEELVRVHICTAPWAGSGCCFSTSFLFPFRVLRIFTLNIFCLLDVFLSRECNIHHYSFWRLLTMSGWLAISCLLVWIWKSHMNFVLSFSFALWQIPYLDFRAFTPYSTQMFLYSVSAT